MTDSTRARLFAVAFAIVAAVCALIRDPLVKPITFDNQIYFYVAERVADGEPPHASLVDHKHQVPALLSGAAIAVGRLGGLDDVLSARLLSILAAGLTIAIVWLLVWRLSGRFLSAHLAALVMLTFPDFFHQAAMGLRPQLFVGLFTAWALHAFARGHCRRAGALAAAAFLSWQPAAVLGAGLGLASLPASDRMRRITALGVGAAATVLIYEAYFLWHGVLLEQLRQSYLIRASAGLVEVPALADTLSFFLRMGLWKFDSHLLFPLTLLVALALTWGAAVVRPASAWRIASERPAVIASVLVATFGLAFTALDHQAYPDLFILQPLIAAVVGVALGEAATRLAGVPRERLPWVAFSMFAFLILGSAAGRGRLFPQGELTLAKQRELAMQIDVLVEEYGPVWAIGCPHLLALRRIANHSPYGLLIDPKLRDYVDRREGGELTIPINDGRPPGVILLARGGVKDLMPQIRRDYTAFPRPTFLEQGIRVWVRRPTWALRERQRLLEARDAAEPVPPKLRSPGAAAAAAAAGAAARGAVAGRAGAATGAP